jgi:signal transduction histidine kinase
MSAADDGTASARSEAQGGASEGLAQGDPLALEVAAKERDLRYSGALRECTRVVLSSRRIDDIEPALHTLLGVIDADEVFLEVNTEDPALGLCSTLAHEVSRPGAGFDHSRRPKEPWSLRQRARDALSRGLAWVLDLDALDAAEQARYRARRIGAELDLPLMVGGRWAGTLGASATEERRLWSEADVELMTVAAEMIGALWERVADRSRLEEITELAKRRARYEHAIAECSQALLFGTDDSVMSKALGALVDATGASYGFIERNVEHRDLGLCSQTVTEIESVPTHPTDDDNPYWDLVPWSQMPDSFERLSRGQPFAFTLEDLGPIERAQYERDPWPVQAEINLPVFIGAEWVGLIGFSDVDKGRVWEPEDVALLKTAADLVGAFWDRAANRERLEQLVESKDRFVASVSHELRTPLSAVVGLAMELRDHWRDFSAEERDSFVTIVADQALEISNIVEDLLVMARSDLETIQLSLAPIDLASEALKTVAGVRQGGEIQMVLQGETPPAWADAVRVRQILRNLLTNAQRYGGSAVRVEVGPAQDGIQLRVVDNGAGIPGDQHEKIFEAYQRSESSEQRTASVGLGLTISRTLARLMDGDLIYRRTNNETVFELTLPRAAEGEKASA